MAYIKDSVISCFKKQLCELERNPDKFSRVKAKFLKNYVIATLEASKTEEVVEAKHGYLKEYFSAGVFHYDCSVCDDGFATKERLKTVPNYCSNCGAKMDGGNAE